MSQANPKKKAVQTQSFEQLVSKASLERLKPYIQQQVQIQGHIVTQKVARVVLEPISQLQIRIRALEAVVAELLNVSPDDFKHKLSKEVFTLEDAALGLRAADYAEAGDTVILYVESKETPESDWANGSKIRIDKLLNKVEDRVQTFQAVEEAVVEMRAGETKELSFKLEPEDAEETQVKFTVERVSRPDKPTAQAVKATEEAKEDGKA